MTPSSLSWTLRHIVPLYRHMAQACLLWTLNTPVPHSAHITDHTPLNQMCNTKIISLHRSTENCRDPARLKIRPLIKLKAWPYTESKAESEKGPCGAQWRYGGWLVRTRFISPVARGYTHSKLSFPLLHSPIKISCSTFIAEISWQFIIFTIVDDIYLHFTSILLNIYHFNGQW